MRNIEWKYNTATGKMPRKNVRIESFRKWEWLFAKVITEGGVIVRPSKLERPLKPSTFITCLNDAKRGYRMFGYPSDVIPKGFDLGFIVAQEMLDGTVQIRNEQMKWSIQRNQAFVEGRLPENQPEEPKKTGKDYWWPEWPNQKDEVYLTWSQNGAAAAEREFGKPPLERAPIVRNIKQHEVEEFKEWVGKGGRIEGVRGNRID